MSDHPENLVQVQKITLNVYGKLMELTPDEARRIRDALVDFIGPKIGVMPHYIQQPIWIDPNSKLWPDNWETCLVCSGRVDLTINVI